MEITLNSTDKIVELNGVRCRAWEGVTKGGAECFVFVQMIAVRDSEDSAEFDAELAKELPPAMTVSLRQIL